MKLEELRNLCRSLQTSVGAAWRTFGPVYKVSYGGLYNRARSPFCGHSSVTASLIFLVVTSASRFSTHDFRALHSFHLLFVDPPGAFGVSLSVDFCATDRGLEVCLLPFVLATLLLSAEFPTARSLP